MKFAFASTLLVSAMAKLASAAEDNFFDVAIHPKCKGVDFDALTAPEKEFVGDALETSYNQIHQLWDGGEWYLFGIEPNAANPELAEGMLGDDGSGYGGGGTCGTMCDNGEGCIDDSYSWAYDDGVLCANNDAILDVTKNTKSKVDRLWEKTFAQKLKEGPYPVFHSIGKCDLTMSTQEAGAPPVEAGSAGFEELKMASIFVKCKQGSFENLSEAATGFLTETLLTAYAKSHDDDELMFNMEWNEGISATNGMAWTAEWGCHKCDNDKAAKKFSLRGKDNKSWADYFVYGLQNSPYPSLKDLNKCKISSMFSDKPFDGTVNTEVVAEVATEN